MMVLALSGSDCAALRWRVCQSAQLSVVRSIGLSRFGRTVVIACSRLTLGLSLHSASSANPNEVSASLYRTCSPALATAKPNSHITVSIGSRCAAPFCVPGPMISFSYLSQLKVARLRSAACAQSGVSHARSSRQATRTARFMRVSAPDRESFAHGRQHALHQRRELSAPDPASGGVDIRSEIAVGRVVRHG